MILMKILCLIIWIIALRLMSNIVTEYFIKIKNKLYLKKSDKKE